MERVIVYAIIYVVQGIIAYFYLNRIFKQSMSKKFTICCYFIVYFIQFITFFLNNVLLNTFMFLIMNFILICVVYKTNPLNAFFNSIIMTSFMSLSEFIIINTTNVAMLFITDALDMGYPLMIIYFVLSKSLYWLMLYITSNVINYSNKKVFPTKASVFLILISIILFIVSILLYLICMTNTLSRISEYILLGVTLFLIITNIFIIWLYDYTITQQQSLTKLKLEHQHEADIKNYNKLVVQHDENQKILIHDIKNHLQTINVLNKNGRHGDVSTYISNLLDNTALTRTYEPTNLKSLNLLLARYITICEEKNINFIIDAKNSDISYLKLNEMTSLFCNLIDNAIEASENVINPHISLSIKDGSNGMHTVISIVNSCENAPITDSYGYHTTKPNPYMHGLGTHSVEKVIKKYRGNAEAYFDENDKEFHVVVLLKKLVDVCVKGDEKYV